MMQFDRYTLTARLSPAFLAGLPAAALAASFGWQLSAVAAFVAGPLTAFGFTMLLSELGRDLGKKKEPDLYREWGGKPSIALLRHRDSTLNVGTKARYHQFATSFAGFCMPTAHQEENDPEYADITYGAFSDWLLEKTRDHSTFPLVFKELVSYGFRRNLLGMRPIGIAITALCLALQAGFAGYHLAVGPQLGVAFFASLALNIALGLCWITVVDSGWVKRVADAYAIRLLAACDHLR
jgi:hypothetical protein